jgi:hypothetical protein
LLADRSRTCCAASARACRRSCCPTYRRSGPPRLNRGQASLFGEVTPCVPPEPAAGQPGNTRSGSRSSRGSRRWRPVGRRSPTTPRPSACAGAAQHARADRVPAGPAVQHSAPRIQRAGRPGPGALAAGRPCAAVTTTCRPNRSGPRGPFQPPSTARKPRRTSRACAPNALRRPALPGTRWRATAPCSS